MSSRQKVLPGMPKEKVAKVKRKLHEVLRDTSVELRRLSGQVYSVSRQHADSIQSACDELDKVAAFVAEVTTVSPSLPVQ